MLWLWWLFCFVLFCFGVGVGGVLVAQVVMFSVVKDRHSPRPEATDLKRAVSLCVTQAS